MRIEGLLFRVFLGIRLVYRLMVFRLLVWLRIWLGVVLVAWVRVRLGIMLRIGQVIPRKIVHVSRTPEAIISRKIVLWLGDWFRNMHRMRFWNMTRINRRSISWWGWRVIR